MSFKSNDDFDDNNFEEDNDNVYDEKESKHINDQRRLFKKRQLELRAMIKELGLDPDDIKDI